MFAAAMFRMSFMCAYAASPGHAVFPTSRWAKMIGRSTAAPCGYGVNSVPSEYIVVRPLGSSPAMPSFQPRNLPTALSVACEGSTVE